MFETQRMRKGFLTAVFVAAAGLVGAQVFAADLAAAKQAITESVGPDGIEWQTKAQFRSAELVVTGPEGFRLQQTFEAGDALFLDFAAITRDYSPNGRYHYELALSPQLSDRDRALAREARALGEDVGFLGGSAPTIAGVFTVADGAVVDRHLAEETDAAAKLLHAANVYIDGSLCVGNDCVNNSAFGFDTIRLEENNLRIKFQDTSVAAAFPPNDWQIVINDSTNGGDSYFAVEDFSAGRQVFRVFAGARSNALVVDSGGDVGIGTATPVLDIHVKTGDSPSLRLEQDGTSGFTPQTWDVAGNETNFFIRDATGGSALPFRIEPGTASNTLYLDNNERVGINDSAPSAPLDVDAKGDVVGLNLGGDGGIAFRLDAGDEGTDFWQVTSTSGDNLLRFNRTGGDNEFEVKSNGNMNLSGTCIEFDHQGASIACTAAVGSFSCVAGACP